MISTTHQSTRRLKAVPLFAAAILALSACGGGTSPDSADASVDSPSDAGIQNASVSENSSDVSTDTVPVSESSSDFDQLGSLKLTGFNPEEQRVVFYVDKKNPTTDPVKVLWETELGTFESIEPAGSISRVVPAGEFTITVEGDLTHFSLGRYQKLDGGWEDFPDESVNAFTGVLSWPASLVTLYEAFEGADNLTVVPDVLPPNITDLSDVFSGAKSFNQDISGWDVSNVTDMSSMFDWARSFNQDISGWDVSNVTNMGSMFSGADSFNQDISGWDVSNVTNMGSMFGGGDEMPGVFNGADSFNQDISGWDVSNVTNMNWMFMGAKSFNQDISGWDVSNVTNMSRMFEGAKSFNQDISGWDVSNVTDMTAMFHGADSFNQDLSGWCVVNVEGSTAYSKNEPLGDLVGREALSWTLPKPVWDTCPA